MSLFYLHIRCEGEFIEDEEGAEFARVEDARQEAVRSIRSLVCGDVREGFLNMDQTIEIQNGAGIRLALWNRSAAKAEPLVQAGAQLCAIPSCVTAQAKLVFLCLLDDKAVERVVFGPDGLAEQAGPDTVFVDH